MKLPTFRWLSVYDIASKKISSPRYHWQMSYSMLADDDSSLLFFFRGELSFGSFQMVLTCARDPHKILFDVFIYTKEALAHSTN